MAGTVYTRTPREHTRPCFARRRRPAEILTGVYIYGPRVHNYTSQFQENRSTPASHLLSISYVRCQRAKFGAFNPEKIVFSVSFFFFLLNSGSNYSNHFLIVLQRKEKENS